MIPQPRAIFTACLSQPAAESEIKMKDLYKLPPLLSHQLLSPPQVNTLQPPISHLPFHQPSPSTSTFSRQDESDPGSDPGSPSEYPSAHPSGSPGGSRMGNHPTSNISRVWRPPPDIVSLLSWMKVRHETHRNNSYPAETTYTKIGEPLTIPEAHAGDSDQPPGPWPRYIWKAPFSVARWGNHLKDQLSKARPRGSSRYH